MLWKWSMGSNTCLALNVEEKGLRMEESTEERQTVEEAKGGLHSAKLPSCEGAYQSQQALIITQQCPNWLTATALLQCFTSLLPGWPSYEVFNRCLLLGSHLVFLPSLLSFLPSIGKRTIVTSESKVQRRLTALCRWWGPHWEPSAAALWSCLAEWMDSASLHLSQAIMIIRVWSQAWLYTGTTGRLCFSHCWVWWCVLWGCIYEIDFTKSKVIKLRIAKQLTKQKSTKNSPVTL